VQKNLNRFGFIALLLGVCCMHQVQSQSLAQPAPGYKNTFGTAASTGVFFNKDAYFWGLGVDYSRLFSNKWVINISMAYDQEISKSTTNENTIVNTLTPSLALGYVISPKFAMGLGAGAF